MTALSQLLARERGRQKIPLRRAALCAVVVASASVALLGFSGWFITASAIAGVSGLAVSQAFNYMLPGATIRLLAILRTGARYGERLASHDAGLGAAAQIRPNLFTALARGPIAQTLALTTGEATARIVQDVDVIQSNFVRRSAPWGVGAAVAMGLLIVLTASLAAAVFAMLCIAALLVVGDRLARQLDRPGRAVQRANGTLKAEFAELAGAAPELRCYGLEDWAASRIDAASANLADAHRDQANVLGWFELAQALALGVGATGVLVLAVPAGAPLVALATLAVIMTVDGTTPMLRRFAERGQSAEAAARLDTLLVTATRLEPIARSSPVSTISFALDGYAPHCVGERVALVGSSGSGKTSLVEMLLGLRPAISGSVFIDGIDCCALAPGDFRHRFAWAPQDAMLLSGTVRDNLLLAAPNVDDVEIWHALRDAALDDRIRALPGGLDGWIGEAGIRLSGGERRRLSLARAYLADAPWLVLDEPTEGIDAATEAQIRLRLEARLASTGQGIVMVTHRPALLALCGSILFMNSGQTQRLAQAAA